MKWLTASAQYALFQRHNQPRRSHPSPLRSPAVSARCRELGIARVTQGANDKLAAFERLRKSVGVAAGACACVGDDLPDVALFAVVGLSFAVADAHPLARRAAHHVTKLPGGRGAVREVCDRLLAARPKSAGYK